MNLSLDNYFRFFSEDFLDDGPLLKLLKLEQEHVYSKDFASWFKKIRGIELRTEKKFETRLVGSIKIGHSLNKMCLPMPIDFGV